MNKTTEDKSKKPLIVRDGARYTCRADGICCTSIHGLGPLTDDELVQIRKVDKRGASFDEDFEDNMLKIASDGGCHFLMPDKLCRVHAEHGEEAKPEGCRKFPLGVTRTPEGLRLTTEHRCTCRTLGTRPLIDPEVARLSVLDTKGRVDIDRQIGEKVRMTRAKKDKIPFGEWRVKEQKMLDALAEGKRPEDVIGGAAFPKLANSSWEKEVRTFKGAVDGTRFGYIIAWVGETIGFMRRDEPIRMPPRTWKSRFRTC